MESNPLLEAIEYNDIQLFVRYLENTTATDIKAHILDLLGKQREKCAEDVEIDHSSYYVKISILNAKLFNNE